jgi:hypothetical protein
MLIPRERISLTSTLNDSGMPAVEQFRQFVEVVPGVFAHEFLEEYPAWAA